MKLLTCVCKSLTEKPTLIKFFIENKIASRKMHHNFAEALQRRLGIKILIGFINMKKVMLTISYAFLNFKKPILVSKCCVEDKKS